MKMLYQKKILYLIFMESLRVNLQKCNWRRNETKVVINEISLKYLPIAAFSAVLTGELYAFDEAAGELLEVEEAAGEL